MVPSRQEHGGEVRCPPCRAKEKLPSAVTGPFLAAAAFCSTSLFARRRSTASVRSAAGPPRSGRRSRRATRSCAGRACRHGHFGGDLRKIAVLLEAEDLAHRGVAVGELVGDAQPVGVGGLRVLRPVDVGGGLLRRGSTARTDSSRPEAVFTSSSGLPSLPLYFFSSQLRTVAPWLLNVTRNRSVSMMNGGSAPLRVWRAGRGSGRCGFAAASAGWAAGAPAARSWPRPGRLGADVEDCLRRPSSRAGEPGLEEVGREKHHRTHQEEGQQQPHFHRHFFSRLAVVAATAALPFRPFEKLPFNKLGVTGPDRNRRHETDGIAPGGAFPSTLPSPRRTVRPPRACSPNRSDRSGRPRAARGKYTTCIQPKTVDYDPLQRRKRRSTSRCSSGRGASNALRRGLMTMDHCGFNRSRQRADGLADAPPDAVAHHRLAERARHGEADAGTIRLRFADQKAAKRGRRTGCPRHRLFGNPWIAAGGHVSENQR